jgi:hypothetical protein
VVPRPRRFAAQTSRFEINVDATVLPSRERSTTITFESANASYLLGEGMARQQLDLDGLAAQLRKLRVGRAWEVRWCLVTSLVSSSGRSFSWPAQSMPMRCCAGTRSLHILWKS